MTLVRDVERQEARRWWYRRIEVALVYVTVILLAYQLGAAHRDRDAALSVAAETKAVADSAIGAMWAVACAVSPAPRCPEYLETLERETDSAQHQRNLRRGVR